MRQLIYFGFIGVVGLMGLAGGVSGMVWGAAIMGLIGAILGDQKIRAQEARIQELETELARYRPGKAPDRAPLSHSTPQSTDDTPERERYQRIVREARIEPQ